MSEIVHASFSGHGLVKPSLHSEEIHARVCLRGHLTFSVNHGYSLLRDLMGNSKPWFISNMYYEPNITRDSDSLLTIEARYKEAFLP